jgi:hypothetical protein
MDAATPKIPDAPDLRSRHVRTGDMAWQLVDRDGPDAGLSVGAGDFVWRPAGSRHVAWCPEGGLMLAIFQVPNKFYEPDGRVTDATGADWAAVWGEVA